MNTPVMTTRATTSWTTRLGLLSSGGGPGSRGGCAAGASLVSVMAAPTLPAATRVQASVQRQAGAGPGFGVGRQDGVDLVHLVLHPPRHRLGHHGGDAVPRQRVAQEG